jgi:transcriptional regulator with XRE-family HTH domain
VGSELREARERAGLTLEEVSERTRIQVKWFDALERGDVSAFPAGPFLAGYSRQYRAFLGLGAAPTPTVGARTAVPEASPLPPVRPAAPTRAGAAPRPAEEPDPVSEVHRPEHTITVTSPRARVKRAGRMAAIGVAAAAGLLFAAWFFNRAAPVALEGVDIPPDQVLLVSSASEVRAKVVADGREIFAGTIKPGGQVKFAAHDRLDVELAALSDVALVYNGRTLKPLGAQSRARRLVFVDDHGG